VYALQDAYGTCHNRVTAAFFLTLCGLSLLLPVLSPMPKRPYSPLHRRSQDTSGGIGRVVVDRHHTVYMQFLAHGAGKPRAPTGKFKLGMGADAHLEDSYFGLQYITLHCITLHYITVQYSTVQTVHCRTQRYTAVQHIIVQYSTDQVLETGNGTLWSSVQVTISIYLAHPDQQKS
jgi:hypothetical protein